MTARQQHPYDDLTGLPGRALLLDRMQQGLGAMRRRSTLLAVLFIDLDHFQEVNAALGPAAGDTLLLQVTKRLLACIRPGDTLARLGNDEFVALLGELAQADDAAAVAQRMLLAINAEFNLAGQKLGCTCSIGIAFGTGSPGVGMGTAEEPLELVQQASMAMSAAKEAGRNTYQLYRSELGRQAMERLEMRTALAAALSRSEFELHYLPRLDLRGQRIDGVEALLRWNHPERGLLLPESFLRVAEDSGLIASIGEWVLEQACTQHRRWLDQGLIDGAMAVNVSAVQIRRRQFADLVAQALRRTGLPADRLELELSEQALMHDGAATNENMERLRTLGVTISVDDFGTGFTSLARLKGLAVGRVKIDPSFVAEITRDGSDAAITLSVIAIAHHLRLRVVAEGVTTVGQLSFLRRHLCDEAQGHAIAHAMTAQAFEKYLAAFESPLPDALQRDDAESQPTLLLVDDEPNVLSALTRLLRRDGYRILTASGAAEALELLATHEVHVIMSDQRMPLANGTDFLNEVKSLYPDTVRIVLSGYTDLQSVTQAINRGAIYRFLTKPWEDEPLRAHIREAFAHQAQLRAVARGR